MIWCPLLLVQDNLWISSRMFLKRMITVQFRVRVISFSLGSQWCIYLFSSLYWLLQLIWHTLSQSLWIFSLAAKVSLVLFFFLSRYSKQHSLARWVVTRCGTVTTHQVFIFFHGKRNECKKATSMGFLSSFCCCCSSHSIFSLSWFSNRQFIWRHPGGPDHCIRQAALAFFQKILSCRRP